MDGLNSGGQPKHYRRLTFTPAEPIAPPERVRADPLVLDAYLGRTLDEAASDDSASDDGASDDGN